MNNSIVFPLLFILSLIFQLPDNRSATDNNTQEQVISCGPGIYYTLKDLPRIKHPRLIYSDDKSDYPRAEANDNRVPAGKLENNVLELNLEVVWSDFYPETRNHPGLRLVTIAEKGKAPTIPAPLIRVPTGTRIHVKLHNTLTDSTATIYGFQKRPSSILDSVLLQPGETKDISFDAGNEGTYMYWIRLGGLKQDNEEQQLAGAFIIDPKGGSMPDRVMVINIFGAAIDTALFKNGYLEALTINGRSWPYTEPITPSVGDTLRWRVINASIRDHPMHLHGFNFSVLSIGSVLTDSVFKPGYEPRIVTQSMNPQSTMNMKWVASRPGSWLFHCHLSFHVSTEIRLPGAAQLDPPGEKQHMAGLVMAIYVKPGPSDLISKGPLKELSVFANDYKTAKWPRNGFSFSPDFNPDTNTLSTPGPLLLLKQYQPTFVTVTNHMSVPTSVHWHGLDLDSWADGVPDWSASDGKMSPTIQPGGKFTYKLTLMRHGTYIYHSHLDDAHQIASGLYGPIIVLEENQVYNPKTDHSYIVGWKNTNPQAIQDLELNGSYEQPIQHAIVGETHRLRFIHIAPAGAVKIKMLKDSTAIPIKFIAKDGTDLPPKQQTLLKESQYFGVGETGDFEFKPLKAGTYSLQFIIVEGLFFWTQKWIVTDK
jgi:FtsP/CotA-like multicopper oxidase with cupredoxin domain